MRHINTLIIGAGAGGLATGSWLKKLNVPFLVIERNAVLPLNLHNGVHYLHSYPILPFETDIREITLTDGILEKDGGVVHKPNLIHALEYSEKVREIQHPSSIFEVGKRDKVFMPKSNTLNELLERMYEYIGHDKFYFSSSIVKIEREKKIATIQTGDHLEEVVYENIVSTAPLNVLTKLVFNREMELTSTPIHIANYRLEKIVPNWMINLYVPSLTTPMYRVSILNGVCSVEFNCELLDLELASIPSDLPMFHFAESAPTEKYNWESGKVKSISKDEREKIVDELKEESVYSIGRFGLWNRKLLIDSTIIQARAVAETIGEFRSWGETKPKLI